MFRPSLKRTRDTYDSPISSSTPFSAMKRPVRNKNHNRGTNIFDSDVSYDSFIYHLPSDSPSNPFKRFDAFTPPVVPAETSVGEHLILRFKLQTGAHDVHRVVAVPANFTFWHLSHLTQFLFGWKEFRSEKNPYNSSEKILRKTEHIFTVHRRITLITMGRNSGIIKDGKPALHIAGDASKDRRAPTDAPWEREERYALYHLWHRPGNGDTGRGVIYHYDLFSKRHELVHITIHTDAEKYRAQLDLDETNNVPIVLSGHGLPNDDDDDDDFALDLQQWNEPHAFENFVIEQEEDEEPEEPVSPSIRLAEEQAIVKKRMSGPLPKRLPIDEDDVPDPEEDVQPAKDNVKGKGKAVEKENRARAPAPVQAAAAAKKRAAASVHLPHPDESLEVGAVAPLRVVRPLPRHGAVHAPKRAAAAAVRLPDPEESREIGACYDDGADENADENGDEEEEEEEEEGQLPPPVKRRHKAPHPDANADVNREESVELALPGRKRSRLIIDTRVPSSQAQLAAPKRVLSPVKLFAAPRKTARRTALGELEALAAESPDDEDEI